MRAIVGPTGSAEQRADADAITRDLLLPRLRRDTEADPSKLHWELQGLAAKYESIKRQSLADGLLRLAVSEEISELDIRASRLAKARLKTTLWPSEPFPETWETARSVDPATVMATAMALDQRMREIEGRYRDRLPVLFDHGEVELANPEYGGHRSVVLARNRIHVALTGDTSVTCGDIYDELARRGIKTSRVPEERPY